MHHVAEEFVHIARILADHRGLQPRINHDLMHPRPVVSLANAGEAFVRCDFDQDPRERLEENRANMGNFHR